MSKIARLQKTLGNNKEMACTPGFIWGKQGTSEYKRILTVEGAAFLKQKKTRASCKECGGGAMLELSIRQHMAGAHGIVLSHTWGVDVG